MPFRQMVAWRYSSIIYEAAEMNANLWSASLLERLIPRNFCVIHFAGEYLGLNSGLEVVMKGKCLKAVRRT